MFNIIPNVKELEKYCRLCEKWQIGFEYNDFFIPDLLDDQEETKRRIEAYRFCDRDKRNDTLHGAFFDIIPFSTDSKIREYSRERMKQTLDIAQQLGCRGIVFHTNISPQFLMVNDYEQRWIEQNVECVEELIASSSDIAIWYENMLDEIPDSLRKLGEALQQEKRFGICLDIAHMAIQKKASLSEWFTQLAPYIQHFHMNDCNLEYDEHLPVGEGKISWKEISQLMEKYHLQNCSKLFEVTGYEKTVKCLEFWKQEMERREEC